MTEGNVPMWDFSDDKEVKKEVSLSEFLKDSQIQYESDWGNGSAVIISFEHFVKTEDEEIFVKIIKEKLGV